jgi:hypothetical protein
MPPLMTYVQFCVQAYREAYEILVYLVFLGRLSKQQRLYDIYGKDRMKLFATTSEE